MGGCHKTAALGTGKLDEVDLGCKGDDSVEVDGRRRVQPFYSRTSKLRILGEAWPLDSALTPDHGLVCPGSKSG